MKISQLRVRKFKRFKDLTVSDIPETTRLVVLIGPNGSGKSSLLDALDFFTSRARPRGQEFDPDYHLKAGCELSADEGRGQGLVTVEFHDWPSDSGEIETMASNAFCFRTSYRVQTDAKMSWSDVEHTRHVIQDARQPLRMNAIDARVAHNYQRMVLRGFEELYQQGTEDPRRSEMRERLIGPVRESMRRVFPGLILASQGNPLAGGTFLFDKGTSPNFRYTNLSGGESGAFELLLDFVVNRPDFNDTVFCIDEPDLHMHSALQGALLEELFRLIPDRCQLWITTHSIGTIRKARELWREAPTEVLFLDFGGKDFDQPVTLTPVAPDRAFWKRTLAVAIDDLADLVAPRHIILCEGGRPDTGATRNPEFDAKCYNRIFEREFPDHQFVSLGGAEDVDRNSVLVRTVLGGMLTGVRFSKLIDRDDRGDPEVERLRGEGTRVLSWRNIESYLWHDEILGKLCANHGQEGLLPSVLEQKARLLEASAQRDNPADDHASIAGELYVYVKRALGATQLANTASEFALDVLAPLVPETEVYRQLKADIFD